MRIIAFIFSLYIIFLAIEPGIKAIGFGGSKTECCGDLCKPIEEEKSQPEKKSESKDCSDDSGCNPFQVCKACTGCTVALAFISVSPIIFLNELPAPDTERIPSQFALDFWQPPKFS